MSEPTSQPFSLRQRQVVHRMAERLWEQHGHPGQTCEPGSKGLGSCALDEERRAGSQQPDVDALMTFMETDPHDNVCFSERDHEVVNEVTALVRDFLNPAAKEDDRG